MLRAVLVAACLLVLGACAGGEPAVVVAPDESFDSELTGGAELTERTFRSDAVRWAGMLRDGDFEQVEEEAGAVIDDPSASTERKVTAYLFRGLAKLGQGDFRAASADLDVAERDFPSIPADASPQVGLLLARGQMVTKAQLGEQDAAQAYLDAAVRIAPERAGSLRGELADAGGEPAPGSAPTTAPGEPEDTLPDPTESTATDTTATDTTGP